MPKRVMPTTWTTSRQLNLGGTVYAAGATVPNAVAAGLRKLSALVSRNFLIPDKNVRGAPVDLSIPTPAAYSPTERETIAATADPP